MTPVHPVQASAIAEFLHVELHGDDLPVDQISSPSVARRGALVFLKKFNENAVRGLDRSSGVFALADPSSRGRLSCSHVIVPDPRLAFARVAQRFFESPVEPRIAATAQVSSAARIGRNVSIGHFSVVDAGVEIGDDTVIAEHVVIRSRTRIGKRCNIRPHAVIGEPGFGFDFDGQIPVRIPHFGGVVLGEDVQVGCGATIACGTVEDTVVEDHVKIDNLVLVAHNSKIERGTVVTGGAILCGRAQIGRYSWIGANATIREGGLQVGEGVLVGLGAVVMRPVPSRHVVIGNPAQILRQRRDDEEF